MSENLATYIRNKGSENNTVLKKIQCHSVLLAKRVAKVSKFLDLLFSVIRLQFLAKIQKSFKAAASPSLGYEESGVLVEERIL